MNDLISRESVISMLQKIECAVEDGDGFQFNEWIDYAKDIPAENIDGDLISRESVIETIRFGITYANAINTITGEKTSMFDEANEALEEAVTRVLELPTISQTFKPIAEIKIDSDEVAKKVLEEIKNGKLIIESDFLKADVDLISRKSVLEEGTYYSNRPTHTFLKDVVKVLPAYSAKTDGDLISRKAVLNLAKDLTFEGGCKHRCIDATEIELLPTYSAEQTYDWCKGCKEYDTEKHCCHRYSSFIRESLQENINAVLEEIKTEIEREQDKWIERDNARWWGLQLAYDIANKHISGKENE